MNVESCFCLILGLYIHSDGVFVCFQQVKVLCGVEHDDLKSLFHVSNPIREAVSLISCLMILGV